MRKILILLLMLFSCFYMKAQAEIVIDYSNATIVHDFSIERNLLIKAKESSNYDVVMRPLEDALSNSDGSVRIPLENVFINNYTEDVLLRYNEPSYIYRRLSPSDVTKPAIARVRDFGMVPAGTYNLKFEVLATNPDTQITNSITTFNLQFIVPVVQEISFEAQSPKITVGIDKVFKTNTEFKSDSNPMVYVKSNTDWVLSVKNDSVEESAGEFYVRTTSATEKVTERLEQRVCLEHGKEVVIAKGKGQSFNEAVAIEYSVEKSDGTRLQPGEYKNDLKFILTENKKN